MLIKSRTAASLTQAYWHQRWNKTHDSFYNFWNTLPHCIKIRSGTAKSLTHIYWHYGWQFFGTNQSIVYKIRSGTNYANKTRIQWNFYRVCQGHLQVVQLNLQSEWAFCKVCKMECFVYIFIFLLLLSYFTRYVFKKYG